MNDTFRGDAGSFVERLVSAVNHHDLETLVDCFASDYRNVTPVHPARGFTGQEQVRRNWTQLFAAVPDLTAAVVGSAFDGSTAWTEWEHRGTRPDGTPHLMRGVIIFGIDNGRASWARFYLEPVETSSGDVDAAIRSVTQRDASS
jgi:ketosteroid isomerase-like protein